MNKIRVFYFQSDAPRDTGLIETREYNDFIDRCYAEAMTTSMARYANVFEWFRDNVLTQCTSPIITRDALKLFLSESPGCVSMKVIICLW